MSGLLSINNEIKGAFRGLCVSSDQVYKSSEIYVNKSNRTDEKIRSFLHYIFEPEGAPSWHTPLDGPRVNHRALFLSIWGFVTLLKGTSAASLRFPGTFAATSTPFQLLSWTKSPTHWASAAPPVVLFRTRKHLVVSHWCYMWCCGGLWQSHS